MPQTKKNKKEAKDKKQLFFAEKFEPWRPLDLRYASRQQSKFKKHTTSKMSTTFQQMPSTALAHSFNSRGELGSFVNPSSCPCTTCRGVVQSWETPVSFAPPPPSPAEMEAAEALLSLSGIRLAPPPPTALQRTITGLGYSPSDAVFRAAAPTALQRSITGFHYSPSDASTATGAGAGTGSLVSTPPAVSEEIALQPDQARAIVESLTEYMAVLRERQDKIYDEACHSHDEMAAQDMEFDEIDRKIAEIDDMLQVLQAE